MKIVTIVCGFMVAIALNVEGSLPVTVLETQRLYLRPVQLSDTNSIAAMALSPDVLRLTGLFPSLNSLDDVENFIRTYLIGNSLQGIAPRYPKAWAIVEKNSAQVIGLIVFVAYLERHQRAELAYVISPDYWNNGYATEACQIIIRYAFSQGLFRLYATVDPANKASERVLQKLNMNCEGLMRSYMIVNGKRVDRKMYAVIADY